MSYARLAARCHADPEFFNRAILGHRLTPDIISVKRAIRRAGANYESVPNRIMAVSCHGSGKSHALGGLICEAMAVPHAFAPDLPPNPGVRVILLSQTGQQAADVVWREVQKQAARARMPDGTPAFREQPKSRWWRLGKMRQASILSPDTPEAAHGRHDDLQVICVDEANTFREDLWPAIESLMSGGRSFLACTLNPVVPSGYLYSMTRRTDQWQVIPISALNHPNVIEGREVIPGAVTRKYVRDLVSRRFEACSPETPWEEIRARVESGEWVDEEVAARALGRFWTAATDTFVSLSQIDQAIEASKSWEPIPGMLGHVGVDVGALGGDASMLTHVGCYRAAGDEESRVRLMKDDEEEHNQLRGPELADRVIAFAERHGIGQSDAWRIHVERTGVGNSACDHLRLSGWMIDEVEPGGGMQHDHADLLGHDAHVLNRRAELWAAAAELFRRGDAAIPARFAKTIEEITAVKKVYDRIRQRLQAEPKVDVKRRLGRSPDHADSFIMALSRAGSMTGSIGHFDFGMIS